jgi:hypothetical protein
MVLKRAGLKIVGARLMLICRNYGKGHTASRLFRRRDQANAVNQP